MHDTPDAHEAYPLVECVRSSCDDKIMALILAGKSDDEISALVGSELAEDERTICELTNPSLPQS
jgi:hypothetical protein